ncbi:MAG: DUF302 domain-containing protein [Geobacteraceae bacterium GWC2_55_20]|nr:MAG: DUF302 domain-containing protein [Geobacteraceae bacterium GWC2_55_20]OGU19299.1 MAG: DUF302 domain-containing protein [Geobacteraceae bacterium GWF2_54_21]HBA73664.1 DUF302 domain-containing protein [Geobacter sp.]HCE68440.1 DUF302 domain-containing protein [Geobacter sp.]
MNSAILYRTQTTKNLREFVHALAAAGQKRGFVIHNESTMEMAHTFGKHGVKVGAGFDLHMIQICKPEKAAASLSQNPERAALMPKFITTFTSNGMTEIRMLRYGRTMIEALVEDDPEFASSLEESYNAIRSMIEESL